jgi:KAP family P-loop domain
MPQDVHAESPVQDSPPPEEHVGDGARYRILLDVPSRQPALGFQENARALKEIITESAPQFAIGIFGGWGAGKTTLMRAIEAELDKDRAIPVQFTAWRYEREEHLIVPLLDTVREALLDWAERPGADEKLARQTASTVGRVMKSIVAGMSLKAGLPAAVEFSFDANKALEAHRWMREAEREARVPRSFYHASFRALEEAFEEFVGENGKRRIVVFVDDLDRSLPESALQVLESMKLFFDLEGFVFVVGLDQEVVQYVIDSKYGREETAANGEANTVTGRVSGEEYIKKIFQLPFRLAPVSLDQLEDFLRAAYTEAELPPEQREELMEFVEPHLRTVVGDAAVNPREIKRYINSYTLLTKVNKDLERHPILALQTIEFRRDWEDVSDAIREFGQPFIAALRRHVIEGKARALQELDPKLEQLSSDFLEYVSSGQPGSRLLEVGDIDRYLYSGEAVRSTHNPRLLDAIREIGKVRLLLREALEAGHATSEALGEMFQLVRSRIAHVEGGVSWATGTMAELVLRDIEAFKQALDELEPLAIAPGGEPVEFVAIEPGLRTLEARAGTISQRLRRLYRAGDIGASQAPHEPPAKKATRIRSAAS